MMGRINEFDHLPDGLLQCEATDLLALLGAPSLFHLNGTRYPAFFVSVLLHGNEISGWNGLRRLLAELPESHRGISIFIGNVFAAAKGMRALPGQQDYNRIWRNGIGEEGAMARELVEALNKRDFFAAVDLHNNTGHNPHYSVLTDLTAANLGLAYLFSDKAVYIEEPNTVLAHALAHLCPVVTLELGPVSDPACDDRAYDYLKRCLQLDKAPKARTEDFDLFHTKVRVHVRDGVKFSFADEKRDTPLVLTAGIEGVNFHELTVGSVFGRSTLPIIDVLQVLDVNHQDVTASYFELDGLDIVLKRVITPAMYTTDAYVIRQDCLCYFMQKVD